MPANLEKRNAVWHFRCVVGGKLYRRTTGFTDLQRAKRRATELENDIRAGKLGWTPADIPTFKAWDQRFRRAFYPDKYTEEHLLKPAVERWATRPLNTISASDVQQFFRDMEADQFAGATLERTRVLLKRLFKAAIADKLIETNPLADIRVFKSAVRDRVLSPEQERRMRLVLSSLWNRYLTVALGTGLRAGEQRGVRPMDLRHDGTWLWVRPETTKTRKGREVPLTADVIAALKAQQESREGDDSTPYWTGGESSAARAFERACKTLKIAPAFTPHDFRRTFGTRCAEKGMGMKHLQMILGHSDIQTTAKFYIRLEQVSVRNALLQAVSE
jgi:integrase